MDCSFVEWRFREWSGGLGNGGGFGVEVCGLSFVEWSFVEWRFRE